jgi:hypothetical protein
MKLLNDMKAALGTEMSPFAAQLLKEDIARLERVEALATAEADPAQFRKKAMVLGWTQADLRTFELDPELSAFLEAAHPSSGSSPGAIITAWNALHKRRMDLLVGCLGRPRIG